MLEQVIPMLGVVIGAVLGYLANFMNSRQQRKWQSDNEYRAWKRTQITNDFQSVMPLMRVYNELAHLYVECCESPQSELAQELLNQKRKHIRDFLKTDLAPFPITLKRGATKKILEDLDEVTDRIEAIGLREQGHLQPEEMQACLEKIRDVEYRLTDSYQEAIRVTFQ